MTNLYRVYTTMGVVPQIKLRPGCLPRKFASQQLGINTSTDTIIIHTTAKWKKLTLATKGMRVALVE